MRVNYLILILLLCVVSSCSIAKIIKYSNQQKVTPAYGKNLAFELEDNNIIVQLEYKNQSLPFMLDMGAPNVVFQGRKDVLDKLPAVVEIGKMIAPNGETIKNEFVVLDKVGLNVMDIESALFRRINMPRKCKKYMGLIGSEFFFEETIALNFDNKTISCLEHFEVNEDWKELDVKFKNGYVYLDLIIDGIVFNSKMDTGYNGGLMLNYKDFQKIKPSMPIVIYGNVVNTAAGVVVDTFYSYLKSNIELEQFSEDELIVNSFTKSKRNLLGMGFLQSYNWIIDYKKKKVYLKKRNIENELNKRFNKLGIRVAKVENKFKVTALAKGYPAEKFGIKIDDELIAVCGDKINTENHCEELEKINLCFNNENYEIRLLRDGKEMKFNKN